MGGEYSILAFIQWRRQGFKSYGYAGFEQAAQRWSAATFAPKRGRPHPNEMRSDLSGRNIIVTGANSGLGYCVAEALAQKQATVHMVCRNRSRGEAARAQLIESTGNEAIRLHICDVSSQQSVREFVAAYTEEVGDLYCLVNNAGCMPTERRESADGNELSFATMAGGTFLLTGLLLPVLQQQPGDDARVINVSSAGMYSMIVNPDDLNSEKRKYDGAQVYAIAKRIQCDLTKVWAEVGTMPYQYMYRALAAGELVGSRKERLRCSSEDVVVDFLFNTTSLTHSLARSLVQLSSTLLYACLCATRTCTSRPAMCVENTWT